MGDRWRRSDAARPGLVAVGPEGQRRWSVRVPFALDTPSLTPGGHILVATRDGQVLRFSPSGERAGAAQVPGGIAAPPLVLEDGSVVAASRELSLERLDTDGRRLFRRSLPQMAIRAPAWDGHRRLVVADGAEVLFLSTAGELLARATSAEPVVGGPVVADDGTAWVVGEEGTVGAFDGLGRVRARASIGPASSPTPMAAGLDGGVRVATRKGALVCIGPAGTERWRLQQDGLFITAMSIDPEGVVVAVTMEGDLLAVGPEGAVRWRIAARPRGDSAPVVARDGTVYVGTSAGTVQAFGHR